MNYLLRNKVTKRSRGSIGVLVAFIFLAIVLVIQVTKPAFFNGVVYSAGNPLWLLEQSLSGAISKLFVFFESKNSLARENQELRSRIQSANLKLLDLEVYEKEHADVTEILKRTEINKRGIAGVLAKPPLISYDILILDRGRKDGIVSGQKIFFENILLGEVIEANANTSRAKLYSTEGAELNVALGENHIPATAYGRGAGNFIARLPKNIPIKKGDIATFPGRWTTYIALVEDIETNVTDSFQIILMRSPVSLSEIKFVELAPAPILE